MNVYEYNILTGNNPYSEEDYGYISSSATLSEDYGQIPVQSIPLYPGDEDFSYIYINDNRIAFGSVSIGGSSVVLKTNVYSGSGEVKLSEKVKNNITFTWVGSGTVFEIGNGLELSVSPYISSGTLRLGKELFSSVISEERFNSTVKTFDSTSLFFDNSGETNPYEKISYGLASRSFDYNESSIKLYEQEDYGLITNIANSSEDYESISSGINDGEYDYEFLVGYGSNESLYPFGTIVVGLGSEASEQKINTYTHVASGTIILSGNLVPPNIDYTPLFTGSGLIFINGSGLESESDTYISSGTISILGSASESYSAQTPENTQLFQISGAAVEKEVDSESGLGEIKIRGQFGPPFGVYIPSYTSKNGNIIISGSSLENYSKGLYYGNGNLFGFGEKLESVTYDYNESSIKIYESFDYGLISDISNVYEDFGLISQGINNGIDDYEFLVGYGFTETTYPFGSIYLSGTVTEKNTESYVGSGGTITLSSGIVEKDIDSYVGLGTIFVSGTVVEKDVDSYVGLGSIFINGVVKESEIETYNGSGSITLSGIATERFSANPPENTQLFQISGTAVEKDIDSYVGLGSLFITGTAVEKDIDSYVGIGTITISSFASESEIETYNGFGPITLSGIATEKFSANPPENTQLFQISGTAVEKDIDSFVGLGTIFISGELRHPNIDYTPHYGKDKNIGIGTTGIQLYGSGFNAYSANTPENTQLFQISGIATEKFSANPPENTQLFQISGTVVEKDVDSFVGSGGTIRISSTLVEKDVDSYVGIGTIFYVSGQPLYSKVGFYRGVGIATFSGSALEKESEIHVGFGTISIDVFSRNYSPIYPRNTQVPGSGIGTIRINDDRQLTICRAVLPYVTRGTIFISGRGFESFSETNYPGTGLFTISGIASTREIAVYTAIGSGSITLSQSGVEKDIDSYVGSGSINISSSSINIRKNSYFGSGTITNLSGAAESISAQTPENTQLFQISGSATESYSAQTPETEVLYRFSGNIRERRTYGYRGTGQLNIGSSARTIFEPRVLGTGLFRFVTHVTDNLYDTCDSLDVTCDYEHSASFRLVSNPPENTILFNISGSAVTKEIAVYIYNGSGTVGISGSVVLRKTKSFVGIGTLTISSISTKSTRHSYIGLGSITVLSGAAKSHTTKPPTSTTLFVFSGSASTRTLKVKRYTGIGTAYFSGSASTKKFSRPSYSGIGTIRLSGQLVYPNIKYVPSPKGFGSVTLSGSAYKKFGHRYSQTFGTLFAFSGGFESFSRTKYIGLGTIYIQSTSGSTINNPYQIPRVYVTII